MEENELSLLDRRKGAWDVLESIRERGGIALLSELREDLCTSNRLSLPTLYRRLKELTGWGLTIKGAAWKTGEPNRVCYGLTEAGHKVLIARGYLLSKKKRDDLLYVRMQYKPAHALTSSGKSST